MSTLRKMSAKRENTELTFEINYPDNLLEAEEMYGPEVVFDVFKSGLDIRAQSAARSFLTKKDPDSKELLHTAKDVPGLMANWQPTKGTRRLSETDRLKRAISDFSPDALRKALAELEGADAPPKKK